MKRGICLFATIILILCGCLHNEQLNQFEVEDFSYSTDYSYYKNSSAVKESGFANTKRTELKTAGQAVELAKKECVVEYNTVNVAFDAEMDIYKVSFWRKEWLGGGQHVYINHDGITQMIVFDD